MNTETRRKWEKNIFIGSILLCGLALMTWTRTILTQFTSLTIPGINVDVATILGVLLIYTGIRYVQHRI